MVSRSHPLRVLQFFLRGFVIALCLALLPQGLAIAHGQEEAPGPVSETIAEAIVTRGKPKAVITPETTTINMTIPYDQATAETSISVTSQGIVLGGLSYGPASQDLAILKRVYLSKGVLTVTAKAPGTGMILITGKEDQLHSAPDIVLITVNVTKEPTPPAAKPTPPSSQPQPQKPSIDINGGAESTLLSGGAVKTSLKPAKKAGYFTLTATPIPKIDYATHAITVLVNGKPQPFLTKITGALELDVPNSASIEIIPVFKHAVAPANLFSDVIEGAWYEGEVYKAYNLGYMRGFVANSSGSLRSSWVEYMSEAPLVIDEGKTAEASRAATSEEVSDDPEERFGVNDLLTRAQATVVFFNMAGGTYAVNGRYNAGIQSLDNPFPDVSNGVSNAYRNAILWSKTHGLVTGYAHTGTFGSEDPITRAQICAIIARYAQLEGAPLSYTPLNDQEVERILLEFPDADSVEEWARASVAWAVQQGIIGRGGFLAGSNPITNAEMAAMVTRLQPNKVNLHLIPVA